MNEAAMVSHLTTRALLYTHGDLDGIASAAVYIYLLRKKDERAEFIVNFAEPGNLYKVLSSTLPEDLEGATIAIMDLGLNPTSSDKILSILGKISGKVKIEWFDHHVWSDSEVSNARNAGISLFLERDTCAAGVVARHAFGGLEPYENLWVLVDAVCSSDLWKWDTPLSPLYYRAFGKREKKMKREILNLFSEGVIWSDYLSEAVEEYVNLELKGYNIGLKRAKVLNLNGINVVIVVKPKGPPNSSLLASFLMSRLDAEIAVVVREDGPVSLRSRGFDVNKIARCLGGGGHPMASGALLKIPIWMKVFSFFVPQLYRTLLERSIAEKIKTCIASSQINPQSFNLLSTSS
ncbi:MAG: DHH family phosphoesterase [Fervidicoccaceae archaeon]